MNVLLIFYILLAKIRLSEHKTKEFILFFVERQYFRHISMAEIRLSEHKTKRIHSFFCRASVFSPLFIIDIQIFFVSLHPNSRMHRCGSNVERVHDR